MSILTPEMVQEGLRSLPHWNLEGKEIVRHYQFPDFAAAMVFVNQVAEKAETAGHHPDIDIRYNKVRLALISHDQGGLTQRDMKMARALESLGRSVCEPESRYQRSKAVASFRRNQAGFAGASWPGFCGSRWRRQYRQRLPKWRSTGRNARGSAARAGSGLSSGAPAWVAGTRSKRNLRQRHGATFKKIWEKSLERNLFFGTASMWRKGEVEPERYSNRDLKFKEICFLTKFGICN